MGKNHKNVDQLDGNTSFNSSFENKETQTDEEIKIKIYTSTTAAKVEDDIIDIDDDEHGDASTPFCEKYKKPPAKVRHPVHGIGTFQRIDSTSGHCVYDFPNATSIMWDSVEI